MKNIIILISACIAFGTLSSCKTTQSYVRPDRHHRHISVYSNSDSRSAMADPRENYSVKKTMDRLAKKARKNPKDVDSRLSLAKLHLIRKEFTQAEKACKSALKININNMDAKILLAQIAFRKGNPEMAGIILNGVGGDRSKDSQVLNMLAMIALESRNPARSLRLFKKALRIDPGNIAIRMNMGILYLKHRQLTSAATQFERILKLMPTNSDAKMHLAIIKTVQGQLGKAQEIFEDVLSEDENNPIALYNLAVLNKKQEEYDDAIANIKAYLNTNEAGSTNNDDAFALIDEIQQLQAEKNQQTISDNEIQHLAEEMKNKKPHIKKKVSTAHYNLDKSKKKRKKSRVEVDNEIESLERQLLE